MSLWTRRCSLDCNKKVNHEMPAERFPRRLRRDTRAHFVSTANWARVRVKNRRKMATKSTPPKAQKQARYQYLIRWLGREDSNLRMAESKSAALPLGYAPSGGVFRRRGARNIASGWGPINGRHPLRGCRPVDRRGAGARLARCSQPASTAAMGVRPRLRSAPRNDAGG